MTRKEELIKELCGENRPHDCIGYEAACVLADYIISRDLKNAAIIEKARNTNHGDNELFALRQAIDQTLKLLGAE